MFVPGKHFQPNIMKQPKGALTYSEIMFIWQKPTSLKMFSWDKSEPLTEWEGSVQ